MTEREGAPPASTAGAVPVCYRHAGRETYLRCSRCDRPICPDCMRPAAVGQHCPDCVAEGRRTTPSARTTLGGRLSSRSGVVTRLLIAVNVVVFVAQQVVPGLTGRGGMNPAAIALNGDYYRLLTAAFLHGGLLHIAFNMWALYVIGAQLEGVLGTSRYVALYFLSALGGSTLSYLLAPPGILGVGASGAIFGLFAALFVVGRRLSADVSGIAALIGVNLVLTFVISNIDWRAHVGGLVTGAVLAAAFAYAPRRMRTTAAVLASVVVAVVLFAAIAARTAALTA